MPHRTSLAALLAAALVLAGCASGPSAAPEAGTLPDAASPDATADAGPGIRAGWMNLKPATKRGQIMSLTLVGESTREGRIIASGKGRMDGGKVVDNATMATLVEAFDQAEFSRWAVRAGPQEAPPGAIGAVWLDRGQGVESLFLLPGAVNVETTKDLPKAYLGLKALIFSIHQATPGSSVSVGQGWSGEDLLNQKPGGTGR